jgi:AcrR family transcriptional regulator
MTHPRAAQTALKGPRRAEILKEAATLFAASGMRTSLREIADACGILPGSMYHHFESKEALIIELIERYQHDLDRIAAEAIATLGRPSEKPINDRVVDFGREIATCAVRHSAASLMALFEPPIGASDALQRLVGRTPSTIHAAMYGLLKLQQEAGNVRRSVDLSLLSDRLCESMMRHGMIDIYLGSQAQRLPEFRCHLLLNGLATEPQKKAALDSSNALRAVNSVIATWRKRAPGDERVTHLLGVARSEFSRRGYEVATLREIAAAAGISLGAVYRMFPSKSDLLSAIMSRYEKQREAAWDMAIHSDSTPLEKLDALIWMHINLLKEFGDETRIQFGFIRETPFKKRRITTPSRLRAIEALLIDGANKGEMRLDREPLSLYARCVYEALWTTNSALKGAGARKAHSLARDTLFSGALVRA